MYECGDCNKAFDIPMLPIGSMDEALCWPCYSRRRKERGERLTEEQQLELNRLAPRWGAWVKKQNAAKAAQGKKKVEAHVEQKPQAVQPVAKPVDPAAAAARAQQLKDTLARMEADRRANPHKYPGGLSGRPRARTLRWATCWRCGQDFKAKSSPPTRPQFCRPSCGQAFRRAKALGLTPYILGAEVVPPRQLMTVEEFEAREPQPRPESSYTPTAWGSANADMDPERERFHAENPDGRR